MNKTKYNDLPLFDLRKEIPAINNYLDVLQNKSNSYISNYEFYYDEGALIGISPEGNWNLYCVSEQRDLIKWCLNQGFNKPGLILGNDFFNKEINNIFNVSKYNPYLYLQKNDLENSTQHLPEVGSFKLLKAHEEHLTHVQEWFEAFNQEQNSGWDPPTKQDLVDNNYYLLFSQEKYLVGAYANSLINEERFWIGRFFIEPKQRRKGLASILLQHAQSLASKNNMTTDLLVNVSNKPAIKFYQSFSYEKVSTNAYWVIS